MMLIDLADTQMSIGEYKLADASLRNATELLQKQDSGQLKKAFLDCKKAILQLKLRDTARAKEFLDSAIANFDTPDGAQRKGEMLAQLAGAGSLKAIGFKNIKANYGEQVALELRSVDVRGLTPAEKLTLLQMNNELSAFLMANDSEQKLKALLHNGRVLVDNTPPDTPGFKSEARNTYLLYAKFEDSENPQMARHLRRIANERF